MNVVLAGEEVRRRQSHEGQPGAIGAAANLPEVRRQSGAGHCRLRVLGDFGISIEHLFHVAVRLAALDLDRRRRVRPHDFFREVVKHARFLVEALRGEIAQQQLDHSELDAALYAVRMHVAFVAVGCLGREAMAWQAMHELRGKLDGAHHPALRVTWVHVEPFEGHGDCVGREVFDLELPSLRPVERVGETRAEPVDVEILRAAADLLVRCKADLDRPVRDLRMGHQMLRGGHDLRHTGFVVRPKQRQARCGDDVVAALLGELGIGRFAEHHRRVVRQHEIAAVVVLVHEGFHVRAADVR